MLIHKIRGLFGSVCKSWSGSYPTSLPKATRTTMTPVWVHVTWEFVAWERPCTNFVHKFKVFCIAIQHQIVTLFLICQTLETSWNPMVPSSWLCQSSRCTIRCALEILYYFTQKKEKDMSSLIFWGCMVTIAILKLIGMVCIRSYIYGYNYG